MAVRSDAKPVFFDPLRELFVRCNPFSGVCPKFRVQDGLPALLPDLPADEFARVVQHALAVAGVAGMADAGDSSRG